MHRLITVLLCSMAVFASQAVIVIDDSRESGSVPRYLFGHNIIGAEQKDIFGAAATPVKTRTGEGVWNPVAMKPVAEAVRLSQDIGVRVVRYPGGCLAHNWRWQHSVGPIATRSNFAFGIDEFIAYCRAVSAEPLITASDYAATPEENAALVEYLNAPADDAHPWAQKRASWGNREPFRVRYIEIGNESYHGNHDVKPFRKYSAAEYVSFFTDCARRMKKVDPAVKLGALLINNGEEDIDPTWDSTVLAGTRDQADFIITHTYAVRASIKDASAEVLARAAMASGEQCEAMLVRYRQMIDRYAGKAMPLFITEYNVNLISDKAKMKEIFDFRLSLASALFNADYIRILMKPEYGIGMANYWQYINGSFGMIRASTEEIEQGRDAAWQTMSTYYCYRLWAQHFGTTLIETSVSGPVIEFEGMGKTVLPARAVSAHHAPSLSLIPGAAKGVRWETNAYGIRVFIDNFSGSVYPIFGTCELNPDGFYRLSFRAKIISGDTADARIGVGLVDERGWDTTHCGVGVDGIEKSHEYVALSGVVSAKSDTTAANPVLRVVSKKPVSAVIDIVDITVASAALFPPYNAVTAAASMSASKDKLYLIIFNKHHRDAIPLSLSLTSGAASRVQVWTVSGASLLANNRTKEDVREIVSGDVVPVANGGRALSYLLPAHSMSAFEIQMAR